MAIFGTKKNTTENKVATKAIKVIVPPTTEAVASVTGVIIRPRVTEKSGLMSQMGVYTFEVTKNANKNLVAKAIKALYKVTPIKVAIINSPAKKVFIRGRRGVSGGVRKAIITLKNGDKIDFV